MPCGISRIQRGGARNAPFDKERPIMLSINPDRQAHDRPVSDRPKPKNPLVQESFDWPRFWGWMKWVAAAAFVGWLLYNYAPSAFAQTVTPAPATDTTVAEIEAQARLVRAHVDLAVATKAPATSSATDAKVAEIEAATRVAEAKLKLAEAEAALRVAKAQTDAEIERLRHLGEQNRQDNEVRRDNSRDDHRPVFVSAVVTGGPYGGHHYR